MPQQCPTGRRSGRRATLNPVSVLNQAPPSSTALPDAALALRPSACPGLLRIVAARDGGICRIKLPGGELSAGQALAIAEASTQHAAGVVELTNRANLQVRGVRSGHEAALSAALVDAGLGPIRAAAADDVRNVMLSPTAGRDPFALFDTRPLCVELLALLQTEARFAALSPKFALLLDGGERLARLDHPHDIWLAATQVEDGVRFVFGLTGCPPAVANADVDAEADADADAGTDAFQHAEYADSRDATERPRTDSAGALGAVLPAQVAGLVRALLNTFLDLATTDATRMRHLLAAHSVDAVLQHAQKYVDFPLSRDTSLANWRRATPADAALRLGAHAQRVVGMLHVGGQPPLGRLDAATLRGLATLSQQRGNGTLRMTPWQSVLLPDIAANAAPAVLAEMNALGLACDPAQPIAHLIACAGSTGCAKSLADTKADALLLADRLPKGVDVHLSGCPRSCAAAHRAPYTLLAAAPGIYDLYRRDGQPGFGSCVAHQLTIEQAADMLDPLAHAARSPIDA
ncbi:oxidoreductase [Paraburkholderia phytofirmans OLGA172]|uniref:Oxidoreductase n=1 Tax=Paraburkholderia phytofirmans OLGA172 TaxID=1417228 RepID=A0A167WDM4_9BURK|nr:oxidoreductase [Paraburkholderia phytofirmans]ANB75973.1 oxidoreductase [Paraburkholderia phytofirmans OLGA172]